MGKANEAGVQVRQPTVLSDPQPLLLILSILDSRRVVNWGTLPQMNPDCLNRPRHPPLLKVGESQVHAVDAAAFYHSAFGGLLMGRAQC